MKRRDGRRGENLGECDAPPSPTVYVDRLPLRTDLQCDCGRTGYAALTIGKQTNILCWPHLFEARDKLRDFVNTRVGK
jgi:hypothetical protein